MEPTCSVEDCTRPPLAQGLCNAHYQRFRRLGDPGPTSIRPKNPRRGECEVMDCQSLVKANGLCSFHYTRQRTGIPFDAYRRGARAESCSVDGCDGNVLARGYCQMHYDRVRANGDPGPAHRIKGENGSKWIEPHGYVRMRANGKLTFEHRYVMEQILGRSLSRDEHVHHINGQRADNRPENLELWVTSHPAGQRPDQLVAWAHEIIERYGALVESE